MAFTADPGSLDPQKTLDGTALTMAAFAYDSLVSPAADGTFHSQLAAKWEQQGSNWVFTLQTNVKCADGSPFTVDDVAANFAFIENEANASPLRGTYMPAGVTAKADPAANTVTLTTPGPVPFFLNGLAQVPLVCKAGMADRTKLAQSSDGTGPYTLTQALSGDQYTFTKHAGYAWGPNGATNSAPGAPDNVVFKIVPSQSTQANLLMSGSINAAAVSSSDQERLRAAKLYSAGYVSPLGEMFFNETAGRPTADQKVRLALTTALDLAQIQQVYTGGQGSQPTTFTPGNPTPCPGDSITPALPKTSVTDAAALLDAAGWKAGPDGIRAKDGATLSVTFLYPTDIVAGGAPAAQLAADAWKQIGVDVHLSGGDVAQSQTILFGSGAWEIAWTGFGVPVPNNLVPVFSGDAPPTGSNFGHVANTTYDAETKQALTFSGSDGCSHWLAAETALVANSDVIPFANAQYDTYGAGATFNYIAGNLIPTSVQLTGK